MAREFANTADFLTVYIKEAHPQDEWQLGSNEKDGVCYAQPRDLEGRIAVANDFVERFDYRLPFVIDDMSNAALTAYAAWPERLYVIGADRRIAYKSGIGPFRFDPDELASWLRAAR